MLLIWQMRKIFRLFVEVFKLNHLNSGEDTNVLSIEEVKALRIRKQRIENERKSRKYISEINKKYKKWKDKNNKSLTKKAS